MKLKFDHTTLFNAKDLTREGIIKRLHKLNVPEPDDSYDFVDSYNYYDNEVTNGKLIGMIILYEDGFRYVKPGLVSEKMETRLSEAYFELFHIFGTEVYDKVRKELPKQRYNITYAIGHVMETMPLEDVPILLEAIPDTTYRHEWIQEFINAAS